MSENWRYIIEKLGTSNNQENRSYTEDEFLQLVQLGLIPRDEIQEAIEKYIEINKEDFCNNPFCKGNIESELRQGGYDTKFVNELVTLILSEGRKAESSRIQRKETTTDNEEYDDRLQ